MRIYGRTETQLRLTEKAQAAYDMTEPITITQYFYPGKKDQFGNIVETSGVRFDINGVVTARRLREVEVNQVLEEWYEQMQELAKEMEGGDPDGAAADNV